MGQGSLGTGSRHTTVVQTVISRHGDMVTTRQPYRALSFANYVGDMRTRIYNLNF